MKSLQWLKHLLSRKRRQEENLERLKAEFKIHYHDFKLLLTANNRTLEIMSEIEEALSGGRPFGMNFVRSRCTRVAANVYQIIKYLDEMSPTKYSALFEKFKEIQRQIQPHLDENPGDEEHPLVMPLEEVDRSLVHQVGGKMANLGELKQKLGINTPKGYVVTARSFWLFMRHNSLQTQIEKTIQSMESDEFEYLYGLSEVIQDLIEKAPFPPDLEAAIVKCCEKLESIYGKNVPLAVRSSSPVEDLPGMSLAGQYHTELGVVGEDILKAYKKVVASKYSYQSMIFRLNLGIRDGDVAMCVGIMPMVRSAAGGVIYTKDPVSRGEEHLIIYSVLGLPKLVVEGNAAVDRFAISRNRPLRLLAKDIANKNKKYAISPSGAVLLSEIDDETALKASLDQEKALELAELALSIESHYGSAQDIEWALAPDGSLMILQSRPLTRKTPNEQDMNIKDGPNTEPAVVEGGVTASPGTATGPVFTVFSEKDVFRFPLGAVLVAQQALPLWAVLLNRAAAIVTESGSVAGHLASVARECGTPALFCVDNAVERLAGEKLVTVDADARKIYKGRADMGNRSFVPPISHIQGSPVYQSLKNASELIIPLNLLDPDGAGFTIENCKTNHDITRYCHEKAVKEIFSFGAEHRFSERTSKRLFVDVPMQYWVIDLDDGFSDNASEDDRFVRLENIVSTPMLALWRGMTAIDWSGPPPVDTRGFMSIVFESTTDPAMLSSGPSGYKERNYFMVTKNFLSFQSRIGYHFASVEALLGDESVQDYLSFVFKGGAASIDRRVARARFLGEILEKRGFHTRVVQDSISARLDGSRRRSVEPGLEIVGYLLIHMRQLDMIMNTESSVAEYREKINADIEKIIAG
jgi:pyruvate,water dikinase